MITASPHKILFDQSHPAQVDVDVTVAISCYNYQAEVVEALVSLAAQVNIQFDLIIVDDASRDASALVIRRWLETNAQERSFRRVRLVQHQPNQGLPRARNTAIALAETPFMFMLDADNLLYPRALTSLRTALINSGCEMAYAILETFGNIPHIRGTEIWQPERFALGNYIDAMTLIRKEALEAVGGYRVMPITGWEDFDLWCAFIDHGFKGCYVPEILCRYREHPASMLRTITDEGNNKKILQADVRRAHPHIEFNFPT